MDPSSLDRNAAVWVCSICGRTRQSPFATPCLGQARGKSCRSCGETLAPDATIGTWALRAAVGNHLV